MKIIERLHDLALARVIVGFLRSNGVEASILDGETASLIPIVGGVRIAVPDEQEDEARRLIAARRDTDEYREVEKGE